jgi:hypothetical protein
MTILVLLRRESTMLAPAGKDGASMIAEIGRLVDQGLKDIAIAARFGITRHQARIAMARAFDNGTIAAKEIAINQILVLEGRRAVAPDKAETMAESINRVGLLNPIIVRESHTGTGVILVAGRHRIEAFRLLGRDTIPAFVGPASTSEAEARMWEITENLHRAELTVQERSDQIAEWIELAACRTDFSCPSLALVGQLSIAIPCKLAYTSSLWAKLGQAEPRFHSSHIMPSAGDRRPMKLSVRATEALKLAAGERDRIVFDEVIPGWGIRLRESGKRYWVFQYAVPDATRKSKYATKRITFGQSRDGRRGGPRAS